MRDKTSISDTFKFDNTTSTDANQITNEFCKYFTNIGPAYASAIPNAQKPYNAYLKDPLSKSIFMAPTDTTEIFRVISFLKSKKSSGHDNLSSSLLKDFANHTHQ